MVKRLNKLFLIKKENINIILFLYLLSFFIFFQLRTVYGGDSGDFLSAAAVWGIAHPPGYPLYTLLAGILHNFFSLGTPAWRVAFLSSIPAALTVFYFYKLLRLFFSNFISLTCSLFLSFLYPFWLYSEVVEVFSLNNFFIVGLTYLTFKYLKTNNKKYIYLFFLTLGASFSHHHIVIFLLPALFFIWRKSLNKKNLKLALLIIPGLLFYLYLPIAASKNPAINWGNPSTLNNFFNVFLRRGYGTFLANPNIEKGIWRRFFSTFAFLKFWLADFSYFSLIIIIYGFISSFFIEKKIVKKLWKYTIVSFLSFLFFLFYASFSLYNDFSVATFERFLIVPYIFSLILLAFSLSFVEKELFKYFKNKSKRKVVLLLFYTTLFIIFPLRSFVKNYNKIIILKNDLTAEQFAYDILNTLEEESGVFLVSDTTWFDTAYVYYSLGYKKDEIKLLNWFSLSSDYYQDYLKKEYPQLVFKKTDEAVFENFVENNWQQIPIYIVPENNIEGFKLVPFGLLFRYYRENDLPSVDYVINKNDELWNIYQDPYSNSLSHYKNLFLADIPLYYAESSKRLAEYLLENQKFEEAEEYLHKSLSYDPADAETQLLLGRAYLGLKKCQQAEEEFFKVKDMLPNNPFPDAYLRQVYLDCYEDEAKAAEFLDSCLQKEDDSLPKLRDL